MCIVLYVLSARRGWIGIWGLRLDVVRLEGDFQSNWERNCIMSNTETADGVE